MAGADRFHGQGILSLAIFDVLRFVQDDRIEFNGTVLIGVSATERVRGDDEIVFGNFAKSR